MSGAIEATSTREALERQAGEVRWSDLRSHAERGALFLVFGELDLIEVALAVAVDDIDRVRAWLESGELARPSQAQQSRWNDLSDTSFRSVVVQPYVLAVPLQEAPATAH